MVVELPDSSGQVDQAAEEEPPCWHHLGVLAGRANQEEVIQVGGSIHLRPPLVMLGQMLMRLERAALQQHDCLMLREALTLGIFSFLRVGEFTMKNRSFNPKFHPTMQNISWSREGMHYFVKQSKIDQMGRGATILLGVHTNVRVQWQQWRPIWDAAAVQPLSTTLPLQGWNATSQPCSSPRLSYT